MAWNSKDRVTVITAICAADTHTEGVALASMEATTREFPNDRKLAGLDVATDRIRQFCRAYHWEMIGPTLPEPPRMANILQLATETCDTEILWTIEHDVAIHPGARGPVGELLMRDDRIAAVECVSLGPRGEPRWPTASKRKEPHPTVPGLVTIRPYGSFNCVAWRTAAFRELDWATIPQYPATDKAVSYQLLKAGWELTMTAQYGCIHYCSRARVALARWKAQKGAAR